MTSDSGKLAIIPARGGSKRIPRKNIRDFAGKPMIAYAIEAARDSKCFEHVIVSTEDAEIAAVSVACGAEVPFVRPADLADDHTPTVPVIAQSVEACRALGWDVAYACCIYPCVPIIDPFDLKSGFDQLLATTEALYSFPVTPFPSPVQASASALYQWNGGPVRSEPRRHANAGSPAGILRCRSVLLGWFCRLALR